MLKFLSSTIKCFESTGIFRYYYMTFRLVLLKLRWAKLKNCVECSSWVDDFIYETSFEISRCNSLSFNIIAGSHFYIMIWCMYNFHCSLCLFYWWTLNNEGILSIKWKWVQWICRPMSWCAHILKVMSVAQLCYVEHELPK